MDSDIEQNIKPAERVVRLALSITLVLIPFSVDAPPGDLTLLPILAIYPGLTAAIGWDPLLATVGTFLRPARAGLRSDPVLPATEQGLAGHR